MDMSPPVAGPVAKERPPERFGAFLREGVVEFRLWGPELKSVLLEIDGRGPMPMEVSTLPRL